MKTITQKERRGIHLLAARKVAEDESNFQCNVLCKYGDCGKGSLFRHFPEFELFKPNKINTPFDLWFVYGFDTDAYDDRRNIRTLIQLFCAEMCKP